jgi:hypothetical protein
MVNNEEGMHTPCCCGRRIRHGSMTCGVRTRMTDAPAGWRKEAVESLLALSIEARQHHRRHSM